MLNDFSKRKAERFSSLWSKNAFPAVRESVPVFLLETAGCIVYYPGGKK